MSQSSPAMLAQEALLSLVKAGLWGTLPPKAPFQGLAPAEWEAIYDLARQQTVTALAFDGVCLLSGQAMPPAGLLARWAAEADAIERRFRHMDASLASLCDEFAAIGLHPVLQKGQGAARHYARPASRECGDIDLYFANDNAWHAALAHIRRHGIEVTTEPDGAIYYMWQGVQVEHHRSLLDAHSPSGRQLAERMEYEEGFSQMRLYTGSTVCIPGPRAELILQYLHTLKHALGRGIGLRQLCDMACAARALSPALDTEAMRFACSRLGISRWCSLLHAFLTMRLGLPIESLPFHDMAADASPLDAIVWRGGNFGQHDASLTPTSSAIGRKMATARSFARNARFALSYAPAEAAWTFASLLVGQFRK